MEYGLFAYKIKNNNSKGKFFLYFCNVLGKFPSCIFIL